MNVILLCSCYIYFGFPFPLRRKADISGGSHRIYDVDMGNITFVFFFILRLCFQRNHGALFSSVCRSPAERGPPGSGLRAPQSSVGKAPAVATDAAGVQQWRLWRRRRRRRTHRQRQLPHLRMSAGRKQKDENKKTFSSSTMRFLLYRSWKKWDRTLVSFLAQVLTKVVRRRLPTETSKDRLQSVRWIFMMRNKNKHDEVLIYRQ